MVSRDYLAVSLTTEPEQSCGTEPGPFDFERGPWWTA